MKLLYTAMLFSFISCTTRLHYVGNSYEASQQVDVFVEQSMIAKSYTIMGKGYINPGRPGLDYIKRVQPLAVATAKQKGADAVLIQGFYAHAPADVHTVTRTDSVGSGTVSIGNATVGHTSEPVFSILFLKYKK